ncbi:hypothetical protein [Brevundimonas lenta]|uniref:Spore coat protein U domain-containing protein n=1 Tax=Brevundimonas lenta TaxID=424796 RepID=A0A7W6JC06_9CAUL|nr:hypothetical protein [Brevundimonas lenta]MBB4082326.1 hypothetical protein [Brevundimonas lenta]
MALRTLIPAIVLAATAGLALPAAAQQTVDGSAEIQATFRGVVPGGCRISNPTAQTSDNAQVSTVSPGSADISINRLVTDDGEVIGSTVVLVLPAACNQAHTINLNSLHGGLQGDGPELTGGPFRSNVPYAVTVSWAGGTQSFATENGALSFAIGDAAAGPVTVTIEIPSGGAPLAAGSYSDELVLELGAAG